MGILTVFSQHVLNNVKKKRLCPTSLFKKNTNIFKIKENLKQHMIGRPFYSFKELTAIVNINF